MKLCVAIPAEKDAFVDLRLDGGFTLPHDQGRNGVNFCTWVYVMKMKCCGAPIIATRAAFITKLRLQSRFLFLSVRRSPTSVVFSLAWIAMVGNRRFRAANNLDDFLIRFALSAKFSNLLF